MVIGIFGKWASMERDELSCEALCCNDADLLAEDCAYGQFKAVPTAGCA